MNDPHTDWRQVNIHALRSHLVDMDNLVSHAEVRMEPRSNGAVFLIAPTGLGGEAAGRMVPAHAPVLAEETGWASDAERVGSQIVWTVTSPTDAQTIRALGFFGLMALGNHHSEHHLSMATGMNTH